MLPGGEPYHLNDLPKGTFFLAGLDLYNTDLAQDITTAGYDTDDLQIDSDLS